MGHREGWVGGWSGKGHLRGPRGGQEGWWQVEKDRTTTTTTTLKWDPTRRPSVTAVNPSLLI